jgi:carboxymethylenebutenolidase
MLSIGAAKRTRDFVAAAQWLKSRPGCTGNIGATGFCFGGGLANTLSVLLGPDLAAAAPF